MVEYITGNGWTLELNPGLAIESKAGMIVSGSSISHVYDKILELEGSI